MYNTAATIRQGAKTATDAKVLKAKLSLNWTGPYKALAVGSCTPADTPDGSPVGNKLLVLDLHSDMPGDMPGSDARRHVSVQRCRPCANPHDHGDMPRYLPAGLTQYLLNNFSKKSPRTTLLKTMFRFLFNDSRWERTPDTNRFVVEVGSSR